LSCGIARATRSPATRPKTRCPFFQSQDGLREFGWRYFAMDPRDWKGAHRCYRRGDLDSPRSRHGFQGPR
jgi:hypothetical protein